MYQLLIARIRCVSISSRRTCSSTPVSHSIADRLAAEIRDLEATHFTPPNDVADQVKEVTEQWVSNFIIKHKLCPFASRYKRSIHVAETQDLQVAANYGYLQYAHLVAPDQTDVSTKLLVFPDQTFMDNVMAFQLLAGSIQQKLLSTWGIQQFEMAIFHPRLNKAGGSSVVDSYRDYSVRSPYPTIHFLKATDTARELAKWQLRDRAGTKTNQFGKTNIISVYKNNEASLKKLGVPRLQEEFQALYTSTSNVSSDMRGSCPQSTRAGAKVVNSGKK